MSKIEFPDDNELEYLSKSKGVLPIPRRPKFDNEDKIFLTNKTKQVTMKKKVLDFIERLTTTTFKSPTKSLTRITPLSIVSEKENFYDRENSFTTADEALSTCCVRKGISHDCQQLCSFKEISDKTVNRRLMFLYDVTHIPSTMLLDPFFKFNILVSSSSFDKQMSKWRIKRSI